VTPLSGASNDMSIRDNILTQVGPGTSMGALMRQYWVPALLSAELNVDGPPVRLKLLGENLLAFRETSGKVGIVDHVCPHRCASLYFGRNEQNGIRCVYHGWKFDRSGKCVDAPNLPDDNIQRRKIRLKAYETTEHLGMVWVYMGAGEPPAELPAAPALGLPNDQVSVWCVQRQSNWLQALEGDIDTSHLGFLHGGLARGEAPELANRAPEYKVADTDCGVIYAAVRDLGHNECNLRFAQFCMPFFTQPPPAALGTEAVLRAFVPMDDEHTMFFSISTKSFALSSHPNEAKDRLLNGARGVSFGYEYLPNTNDWYSRWRLKANATNDYCLDRDIQRSESFTGIEGFEIQDIAITESMGPIVDHGRENLAPSDIMISRTRRRLTRAARAHLDQGTTPPGARDPKAYASAWSGYINAPADRDWLEVFNMTVAAAQPEAHLRRPMPGTVAFGQTA
jgi:phthalate 4,5-dioxygenase